MVFRKNGVAILFQCWHESLMICVEAGFQFKPWIGVPQKQQNQTLLMNNPIKLERYQNNTTVNTCPITSLVNYDNAHILRLHKKRESHYIIEPKYTQVTLRDQYYPFQYSLVMPQRSKPPRLSLKEVWNPSFSVLMIFQALFSISLDCLETFNFQTELSNHDCGANIWF